MMKLESEGLNVWLEKTAVLKGIETTVKAKTITALLGPSGCGKTTLLRTINRMAELTPGFRKSGRVLLNGQDIYAAEAETV